MHSRWKDLALYHYSSAPTLTSTCSVCGLRHNANKSLYVKIIIFSSIIIIRIVFRMHVQHYHQHDMQHRKNQIQMKLKVNPVY
jgi:hypothetical protein